MGFFRHHAIVVTCGDEERTKEVRRAAYMMGCHVTNIIHGDAEPAYSFMVAPDGAKELCEGTSSEHDERRNQLIAWFIAQSKTRSFPFDWMELEFGGDTGGAKVLRHGDDPRDEATKEAHRLIPREPLMTWNRCSINSEAMPVTASTPCPRCGSRAKRISEHFLFEADALVLGHCEFYAVAGDTVWVNQRSCEKLGDLQKFLDIRAKAMKRESVPV